MNKVQPELFGSSAKIMKALNYARNVSVTKNPILLVGEIGVGKKSMATYIHKISNRKEGELLCVDCSQEESIVEGEILGRRDESTGKFYRGILERANGGSIILENIDGLSEKLQMKLYKIFNELSDYEIDVRIMGTTTKNLSKLVGSGRFHRAMYIFLASTQINIPPLRERIHDIESMVKIILANLYQGSSLPEISNEGMRKIREHYWTHNMNELKSVLEGAYSEDKTIIDVNDLDIGERKSMNLSSEEDDTGLKLMSLKEAEKLLIRKALIHTSENRTQAAKILGVSIRTLRNKINEYRNEGSNYFVNLR